MKQKLNSKERSAVDDELKQQEIKNQLATLAQQLNTKAPDTYRKMVKLLNVTRASLSSHLTEDIHLQLAQTEDFLSLQQQLRPGAWEYKIDNQLPEQPCPIPRLMLKNLAENAIKHGISQ